MDSCHVCQYFAVYFFTGRKLDASKTKVMPIIIIIIMISHRKSHSQLGSLVVYRVYMVISAKEALLSPFSVREHTNR